MKNKSAERTLKVFTAIMLCFSLVLTFTVSDYYIFDKFTAYNPLFIICQWVKKAGILLLPLAVYYKKRSCADIAKYVLPVFIVISLCTYGNFFDITMLAEGASPTDKVYASVNEFIPKNVHGLLFFLESELMLAICALLFVRDGFKVAVKSFKFLPLAILAVTPLNIFENFYDETAFGPDSFLWFKNFTVWHAIVLFILAGFTIGCYYFLKNKPREKQHDWLAALAISLLIQYHSKDSVVMGDGYNVYHTVFACIPLFICNIGVYVACLSVFLRKRVLYAIAFFVHAIGALTVFLYFGRDDMSNYGIFCGYTILFFCFTHCILFVLSVLPSALGHYKFRPKDAIIPLIYYCIVIVVAAVSSGLVTSASMGFTYDGYTLHESEWLYPNYAFTQVNPLPVPVPNILPLKIWRHDMNGLYLIFVYMAYVMLFYAFNGAYYAFLAVRKKVLKKLVIAEVPAEVEAQVAVTDNDENKNIYC